MSKMRLLELLKRCAVAFLMFALQAQALAHIAQPKDVGSFEKYLAHAALGCGVGAVRSDSSDGCAPGAAGAVVAHYGAGLLDGMTGYTLSDSDVSFYSSLAGGTAAALVGDKDALEGNFGLGQSAGQNAVDNNYLKSRELAFVLDQIKRCNGQSGCGHIIEQLQNSIKQGGWQHNPEQLKDRCHGPNPMSCVNDIQDMSGTLELLKDPLTRQLLGERATEILIERQLRDMAHTMVMIEQGQVKFENNKDMLEATYGATKTAIELCAVVPLAGPCRAADWTLTAAEIGVGFARGDSDGAFLQLGSEAAAMGAQAIVSRGNTRYPDALSKNALEWWGNVYGYLAGKAVGNAPDILDCGKINCRQEGSGQ